MLNCLSQNKIPDCQNILYVIYKWMESTANLGEMTQKAA